MTRSGRERRKTMQLLEVLVGRKALQDNIAKVTPCLMQVTKRREGAMPAEGPQESPAALEANLQHLWQRFPEAFVTSARPLQDRYTYTARARHDGGRSATTGRGRPAIRRLLGTGRYHSEGGLRHVPAIAGPAHSQAPPVPHSGDAGNRSQHT
jgi:hypothetical protein